MNKMKVAFMDVLKRQAWMILFVFVINVAIKYWRDGQVSLASCVAIMFGIFLVSLLFVVAEIYWMSKRK